MAHTVSAVAIARPSTGGGHDLDTVVLAGGVFQNVLLTELCLARLAAVAPDLTVLTARLVPPNDGGLALGQAWVAAHADLGPAEPAPGSTPIDPKPQEA